MLQDDKDGSDGRLRIDPAAPARGKPVHEARGQTHPGLVRRALGLLVEIVVAVYVVADTVVSVLMRPVMRFLSSLRIVQRAERAIQAMPPYVILVVMVVPFIIAELAKVFAVFWMSEGHMRSGMTIFIGAYIVSIFVCERILHAGKDKLLTIAWFAWAYNWVMAIKDHVFGWFRETSVWRVFVLVRERGRVLLRRTVERLRGIVGTRPRGALERR